MGNMTKIGVLNLVFGSLALFSEVVGINVIKNAAADMQAEISQILRILDLLLKYSPYIAIILLIITGIVLLGYKVRLR